MCEYLIQGRKITMADGNGAQLSPAPTNFNLPLGNRRSPLVAKECHHLVSVRAGTRQTTSAPLFLASRYALPIHSNTLEYGGFIKTVSSFHGCASPSCSFVKNFLHFAVSAVAHGSRVKPNSRSRYENHRGSVAHSSLLEEVIALSAEEFIRCYCYSFDAEAPYVASEGPRHAIA